MITHMYEANDDTDEKANLKANYPIAYPIAKFANPRPIDVTALRDAVKSRLKAADLPNYATRKDYFHALAVAWLLTSSENGEGAVVPINEVHANHAKDNVPKPRLCRDLLACYTSWLYPSTLTTAQPRHQKLLMTIPMVTPTPNPTPTPTPAATNKTNVRGARGRASAPTRAAKRRGKQL
jgi:hypothetical protein